MEAGYLYFVNHPSTVSLSLRQKKTLNSLVKSTRKKDEYRKYLAVLRKSEGRTYLEISKEYEISSRSVQRWIAAYTKKGIDGLKNKKPGGAESRITDEDKEIILSVLFNDPHIFGYLRNTWSLRSLARCLTDELGIQISFRHLQRITRDMGIRCKRPKLELLHGPDYKEGKTRVKRYKQIASALKKKSDVSI
jgi:transposase